MDTKPGDQVPKTVLNHRTAVSLLRKSLNRILKNTPKKLSIKLFILVKQWIQAKQAIIFAKIQKELPLDGRYMNF